MSRFGRLQVVNATLVMLALSAPLASRGQAQDDAAAPSEVGLLRGHIVAAGSEAPLAGVLIETVVGSAVRYARTNATGAFEIELPAGEYALRLSHPRHGEREVAGVRVDASAVQETTLALAPDGPEEAAAAAPAAPEEITVTASYRSTPAAQQRFSASVMDVIGREDFTVTGDSSAVDALKRVTGLTVVNDKYIYVRGLGERYSNTTFNGAALPSPDPTRRVVPMDLFPTGVLEAVEIEKTYLPYLPGDFSGGLVELRARAVEKQGAFTLSVATTGNTESIGEDAVVFQPGGDDWTGFDDGARDLPDTLDRITQGGAVSLASVSPGERQQAGLSLDRGYEAEIVENPAGITAEANWSSRYDVRGEDALGVIVAARYGNAWQLIDEERRTTGLDGDGGTVVLDESEQARNTNSIDLAVVGSVDWALADAHSLAATTLVTRSTENTTIREFGHLAENDIDVADTLFEWVERQLVTQQVTGNHLLEDAHELEVDWRATWSVANREEPDTRFYRYEQTPDSLYQFSDSGTSNERSWEDLEDTALDFGVDLQMPFDLGDTVTTTVRTGAALLDKDRDSSFRRFRFISNFALNDLEDVLANRPEVVFADENVAPGLWELRETTQPTDNYRATERIVGTYAMADAEFGDRFRVTAGARKESFEQEVTTFDLINPDQAVVGRLDDSELLPAVAGIWHMNEQMQLRLGASRTLNRPDLKELSSAPYIDPEERYVVIGNPDLRVALIDNYDLRWEWYWSTLDSVQVALFHKDFEDPIERVVRLGGAVGGVRTFANAESATSDGVEVTVSQNLGFIHDGWSDFWFKLNAAVIDSEVDIGKAGAQQTTNHRELQGQSPWVGNLQFGYDNPFRDLQVTLAYNVYGERITDVGTQGLPDAYEQPAATLDLSYRHGIELFGQQFRLKAKALNLLDPKFEVERGDVIERSFRRGATYYLGFDWVF
jgi:TonB-dependent receptor